MSITCNGPFDGAEVIQVYVQDIICSVSRPVRELRAFQKVYLQPGETRRVVFDLDREAWKFWDETNNRWTAEAGDFKIMVGSSSTDIRLQCGARLPRDLSWK